MCHGDFFPDSILLPFLKRPNAPIKSIKQRLKSGPEGLGINTQSTNFAIFRQKQLITSDESKARDAPARCLL